MIIVRINLLQLVAARADATIINSKWLVVGKFFFLMKKVYLIEEIFFEFLRKILQSLYFCKNVSRRKF